MEQTKTQSAAALTDVVCPCDHLSGEYGSRVEVLFLVKF